LALGTRLRATGYEVLTAPDPAFAILLACVHLPDLIISDIFLPVMQGLSFVRRLRSLGLPEVPVIFITASQQNGLWESAMQLHAAGYLKNLTTPHDCWPPSPVFSNRGLTPTRLGRCGLEFMKTILVADDDRKITFALAKRLASAGYDVLTAPNGLEALQLALEERPDLLLMDVWMPPGYGLSVAERLHQLGIATPVIFLSGSHDPDIPRVVREIGAAGYLEKPYDPQCLLAAVADALATPH